MFSPQSVKVYVYSQGSIPWPAWRCEWQPVHYCGDLVKALRTESLVAIRYHWGVSHDTVSMWRKCLRIERNTPGTLQLFWRTIDLASARAKMSRKREGRKDLMTKADRERLGKIQRRPKPEAWKRIV